MGKQIILAPLKEQNRKTTEETALNSNILIKGRILDEKKLPLSGAVILADGNNKIYSVSNAEGNFEMNLPATTIYLLVNLMGYESQRMVIQKGKSDYQFGLNPKAVDLSEVVVVGYGTTTVRDLTGSIASINSKDIANKNVINATSLLQNMAAGVQVSQNTGKPGENIRVRVRGAASLTGSNEPLYVIDGIPMDDPSPLNGISPSDIESIDILKDASATAIYGSRAANGVVLVTTMKGSIKATYLNYLGPLLS